MINHFLTFNLTLFYIYIIIYNYKSISTLTKLSLSYMNCYKFLCPWFLFPLSLNSTLRTYIKYTIFKKKLIYLYIRIWNIYILCKVNTYRTFYLIKLVLVYNYVKVIITYNISNKSTEKEGMCIYFLLFT